MRAPLGREEELRTGSQAAYPRSPRICVQYGCEHPLVHSLLHSQCGLKARKNQYLLTPARTRVISNTRMPARGNVSDAGAAAVARQRRWGACKPLKALEPLRSVLIAFEEDMRYGVLNSYMRWEASGIVCGRGFCSESVCLASPQSGSDTEAARRNLRKLFRGWARKGQERWPTLDSNLLCENLETRRAILQSQWQLSV